MAWRYVNPGYAGLLTDEVNTSYLSDITDASKSKTGVAYKNTEEYANRYKLALPENGEYWVKADFFWENGTYCTLRMREPSRAGLYFEMSPSGTATIYYFADKSYRLTPSNSEQALTGLKMNAINTIWLHVKWGSAGTGFLEFQINNKKFDKIQDRTFNTQSGYFIFSMYGGLYSSSVIISDEEISPYEELVRLPVSSTTTDMGARDGGGYIASDTTQTLLQSVDITALAAEYGSDAKVTSAALVGNPAYEVDEVLTKMTSLTKTGGVTTEYETVQLSANSESVIVSSFVMASDTTLGDLANWQFGWKASE